MTNLSADYAKRCEANKIEFKALKDEMMAFIMLLSDEEKAIITKKDKTFIRKMYTFPDDISIARLLKVSTFLNQLA